MLLGTYTLFSVMSHNWNINPFIHIRTREVIWKTRRIVDQTTTYGEQQMLQKTRVLLTLGLVEVSDNSIVFDSCGAMYVYIPLQAPLEDDNALLWPTNGY